MITVIFLVTLLIIITILIFTATLKVIFYMNSEKTEVCLDMVWLYPFMKLEIKPENKKLFMILYVFKKKVFTKEMKRNKDEEGNLNLGKGLDMLKKVRTEDLRVDAVYGFKDPFVTGITCGAISIASEFLNTASLNNNPDFASEKDYFKVDASAKVNIGSALVRFLK